MAVNASFPYTAELKPFQVADDTWSASLRAVFGKDAGQARYEPRGRGQPGSALRRAYQAREAARVAWYASADRKQERE